jgi:DNA-binding MarR family transcriptional regulator
MGEVPTTARWLDSDQQRSWRAFVLGSTLLFDRLAEDLRRNFGIGHSEYEVLVRLSEREGGRMRMAQLADAMCHSRSRVTHTVARMERAGLIRRTQTPDDGRGVIATMTGRGRRLLEAAAPLHVTGVRENLVDLCSPEDFEAFGRVMNAVADKLVTAHPEAELR